MMSDIFRSGANMTGANMTGVNMIGANMTGVNGSGDRLAVSESVALTAVAARR